MPFLINTFSNVPTSTPKNRVGPEFVSMLKRHIKTTSPLPRDGKREKRFRGIKREGDLNFCFRNTSRFQYGERNFPQSSS